MASKKTGLTLGLGGLISVGLMQPSLGAPIPVLQTTFKPDYVSVDGDLKEWTLPPQLILGTSNQVAGTQKIASAQDFSARIWLKMNQDSVWLAGQIQDDKVRFPGHDQWLNADHVEFWLAFPQARMPVMGFSNQFGFHEVATAKNCVDDSMEGDAESCQKWFQAQTARRQWLPNLFLRQFIISPHRISEAWWSQKKGPEPLDLPPMGMSENRSVFKVVPGGYQFEAEISSHHWPATQQWPVTKAHILVDIVDNDTGTATQEHFVSSSPQRKYGQPSTFNPLTITYEPEQEEEWLPLEPNMTTEILNEIPMAFVFASHPAEILGFINLGMGYQFSPSEPSPAVVHHKISDQPLLIAGDYRAYLVPDKLSPFGFDQKLVSFKGQNKVAELKLQGRAMWGEPDYALTHYTPTHALLALFSITTMSPFGSGACGACPYGEIETLAMDRTGTFKALKIEDTGEQSANMSWPRVWVEPNGASFGFSYTYDDPEQDTSKAMKQLLKWTDLAALAAKH